jgi:hypothetical protein
MMHHAVTEGRGGNQPMLGFKYFDFGIAAAAPGAALQTCLNCDQIFFPSINVPDVGAQFIAR